MPRPKSEKLQARLRTYERVVDIAEAVRRRDDFRQPDGDHLAFYEQCRELGQSCTQLASVEQLLRDSLTEWNEGVGAAVEEFWRRIEAEGVDVRRKTDIVAATLKRGRILDQSQFYELEDHFEELQTCGKITSEEADRLNAMLDRFESDPETFR